MTIFSLQHADLQRYPGFSLSSVALPKTKNGAEAPFFGGLYQTGQPTWFSSKARISGILCSR
ncbi:hypothetical protein HNQ50_003522 [Silvimonas terrae]|uniref:Uncharacterized protein n=1 Tax=Silvimonas terrae TaxID=300266 RepID=A0A840RJS5_9NEIS|nr:hypothetical protein [Silvimonas terrae]